jgi:hypothetical protein
LSKICDLEALGDKFHDQITNLEALAFYVYSTANGWHSYINEQLWSGSPSREVVIFAQVLNSALDKIVAITGKQGEPCIEVIIPVTSMPSAHNTFRVRL